MSWFDRRAVLAAILALPACGFTPAYGPGGGAGQLAGRVAVAPATTDDAFVFNARIEDRLGRASDPAYRLDAALSRGSVGLGATSTGATTRFRLTGTATFALRDAAAPDAAPLIAGSTEAFTGYSATGNAVATLAAEEDAQERLMVLLADQVIDRLLLEAGALSP